MASLKELKKISVHLNNEMTKNEIIANNLLKYNIDYDGPIENLTTYQKMMLSDNLSELHINHIQHLKNTFDKDYKIKKLNITKMAIQEHGQPYNNNCILF
jgi:hypothetical protein